MDAHKLPKWLQQLRLGRDSHVAKAPQGLMLSATAFPGHQQKTKSEVEQQEIKSVPTWHTGVADGSLISYTTMSNP